MFSFWSGGDSWAKRHRWDKGSQWLTRRKSKNRDNVLPALFKPDILFTDLRCLLPHNNNPLCSCPRFSTVFFNGGRALSLHPQRHQMTSTVMSCKYLSGMRSRGNTGTWWQKSGRKTAASLVCTLKLSSTAYLLCVWYCTIPSLWGYKTMDNQCSVSQLFCLSRLTSH